MLPAPALPGGRRWSTSERDHWERLWSTPQATRWDPSMAASVGLYVTYVHQLFAGKGSGWTAQEARRLGDELGLTPHGLNQLGWRIAEPEEDEDAAAEVVVLQAVGGGDAG
jgi:hypothetical protein